MLILGIADNHDSGAALVRDGALIAAVGQERLDRVKNSGAFPWAAIEAVLDAAGVKPPDIDRVVFGTAFTPSYALRRFPDLHHRRRAAGGQFSYLLNLYVLYQVALRATGLHAVEIDACRDLLSARLRERGFRRAQISLLDHHRCHAEAAYRSQPRPRALVLTLDAMGDGLSATVSLGRMGELDRIWEQSGFAAINTYYSRVTEWLGFTPNRHEGKITGLAAYAEPPEALLAHFHSQLRFVGPGFSTTDYTRPQRRDDPFYRALEGWSREQVAAALQANLERAVTAFVRYWMRRCQVPDLALCGGVFANVKLNQRIAELPGVRSLWVYPNMGDGGLAAGAAMADAELPPARSEGMYLGPSYPRSHIARELSIAGLRPDTPEDLPGAVARLLADGKVVARFAGAAEWGPRALGNRSVLVRPDDPGVNDWLNKRLKRTEFMPFAPAVMARDAPRLFAGFDRAREAARFMTVCFDCTELMRRLCPGVVHADGTARPQVVYARDNPEYYAIIKQFKALTGLPAIINTSFNMHEEPIVCSPHDAIRAWRESALDALAIGPYLVVR